MKMSCLGTGVPVYPSSVVPLLYCAPLRSSIDDGLTYFCQNHQQEVNNGFLRTQARALFVFTFAGVDTLHQWGRPAFKLAKPYMRARIPYMRAANWGPLYLKTSTCELGSATF